MMISESLGLSLALTIALILFVFVMGILIEREKIRQIRNRQFEKQEKIRREKEERLNQAALSAVKVNSQRYKALLSLSERYHFDSSIQLQYVFYETVHSKTQLDRFDFDEYLIKHIEQSFEEQGKFITRVNANRTLYLCYEAELKGLPDGATYLDAERHHIPYDLYRRTEQRLCEPLYAEEFALPVFLCHVQYRSPQGRNSYRRDYTVVFEKYQKLFDEVCRRKATRNTAYYQRKIMTDSLRYDIMKRDHFRCVLCGRSSSDGVTLHVDHILPVSKGGKTEPENLRTLCSSCNMGKRDKYDQYGEN